MNRPFFPTWSLVLMAAGATLGAETLTVTGRGEVPAPAKGNATQNQQALAKAEEAAKADAILQAIQKVYGGRDKMGAKADQIISETTKRSAGMMLGSDVKAQGIQGSVAFAEVVFRFDGKALRAFLEDNQGLSLTQEAEGKFKVVVLSYTVEGQDADRNKPQVLREEVRDDRINVQAASAKATATVDARSARQTSLQGDYASSKQGSIDGRVSKANGDAASVDGAYDHRKSGAVDYRDNRSSSVQAKATAQASMFSDTSSFYERITVYADPNQRGAGSTNEVRAKLGELIKGSGLQTRFVDVNLMGREFRHEDELYSAILQDLKARPELTPEDYVAVALNRLTATQVPGAPAEHRFTSQVVYRVLRIRDGEVLVPDKLVTGDSGRQASDDLGRSVATEVAVVKAAALLPQELRKGLQQMNRTEKREAAATTYLIRVDGVGNPASTVALKQALRQGGYTIRPQFRSEAKTETITVELGGKTGADVMALLEAHLGAYQVQTFDERNAILRLN